MFTKTLKQLWDEVEAKAEQLYIDIESPEFKLLKAMAERCHKIEVELGFVLEDHAPGAGIQTATDLALAAAGQRCRDSDGNRSRLGAGQIAPAAGDPAAPAAGDPAAPKAGDPAAPKAGDPAAPKAGDPAAPKAGENAKEPVWDGKRHI